MISLSLIHISILITIGIFAIIYGIYYIAPYITFKNNIEEYLHKEFFSYVKAENLTATEEDVEEEIKKLADGYGMDVDQVKTYMDDEQREQMKMNIAVQKAIDLVYAAAK